MSTTAMLYFEAFAPAGFGAWAWTAGGQRTIIDSGRGGSGSEDDSLAGKCSLAR